MKETRTFGLLGGLGLEAGIYYYEHLAQACAERDVRLRMVLVHADVRKAMGHMMAGEREQLAEYLIALVHQLAEAGAQFAAIPAVTPHACIEHFGNAGK